ncbi:hypothetical protein N309_12414, partial [Tinamus guttatus]
LQPTNSPWNTPVFVIPKKNGKWRMLHDLRAINAVIEPMGALQPGLPSPAMLPAGWPLIVIDLKDCFFTIPLHRQDAPRFVFSVPSLNHCEPMCRYHWAVLPQGMANSPTICQMTVARMLQPIRQRNPDILIYHYMDDILISGSSLKAVEQVSEQIQSAVIVAGLQIAKEKVQQVSPWNYLGWRIRDGEIRPRRVKIGTGPIRTLNDLQRLLGAIKWIQTVVGLTNEELQPLF